MSNIYAYLIKLFLICQFYNFNLIFALCSPGAYKPSNSLYCTGCNSGMYCPDGVNAIPCPLGTSTAGQTGSVECYPCREGYYANVTGSRSCIKCPNGYYCKDSTVSPTPCPLGTYSSEFYGISECTQCKIGYFTDQIASTYCKSCPDGHICNDPAFSPIPCPLGTHNNIGFGECIKCEKGYYADKIGLSFCLECPRNHYCNDSTVSPKPCPLGSDSSNGKSECTKCKIGYYADKIASSCLRCDDGHYCCDPTKSPTKCPLGTYSYSWSIYEGISECYPCPGGYYANLTGSRSCIKCPNGYYCCDPTISPIPCPLGTYSSEFYGISECKSCPNGYFTNQIGSTHCTSCPNSQCPTYTNPTKCLYTFGTEIDVLICNSSNYIENSQYLASIGDCNFYNQFDKELNCGSNGYLIKYGLKYCKKFGDNINSFNEDGKKWVNSVRKCLMDKLYKSGKVECNEVEDFAFESHLGCYLNPGYGSKSICDVWFTKNFVGLWNVYELADFLKYKSIKQVLSTMKNCAYQYVLDGYEVAVNLFNSFLESVQNFVMDTTNSLISDISGLINDLNDVLNIFG